MTREEAIHRIKDHMVHHGIGRFPHILLAEAMKMAISALREQEERSKGCEYCARRKSLPIRNDLGHLWIENGKLNNLYDECKINFCPMCGRKLEVEG